jgi:hypothetical protein
MNVNQAAMSSLCNALSATFTLGFKFLVWLNGLGVLLVLGCAMGIVSTELEPQWLRMPLAVFLAGLVLSGLGLLWSYLVQASLFRQVIGGHLRRTHWIPLFCAMVAYSLSLAAFVVACWITLALSGMAYQGANAGSADEENFAPFHQFDQGMDSASSDFTTQPLYFVGRAI